ncbi:MAG TPA: glycosyltransferase family 4 protein [bacterium]|nr:glycosyltransferase family 4 protein [bacterium]
MLLVANVSRDLYNFRIGLMRALKSEGFEVIAVAPEDNFSKRFIEEDIRFIPINLKRGGRNPLTELILILKLYEIYKKEKPSLVIHYTIKPNIYGNIASRLAKTKSISVVTGLGSLFVSKSVLQEMVSFLYRFSFKFCDRVFFLNSDDRNYFINRGIVQPEKTVLIKGEGIDTEYFSKEKCLNIPEEDNNIVFLLISRMIRDKGIWEFVESARIVKRIYPSTNFWLLGPIDKENPSGITIETIRGWEEKGLVSYLGVADDVRPLICKSDVVVLPSYREGIPQSLLEAMSMEKPIITTDSIGCRDVVEDGKNGFLVPVKNPEALADAMIKMIEMTKEEREEMGKYGRNKVLREFDEKIIIRVYLEEIGKILSFQED